MPDNPFSIVHERAGDVAVLRVSGAVDHVQYHALEEAIQTELDRRQLRLVVDLSELTYISSAGINVLGHAVSQYEKVAGKFCLVRPVKVAQWHFFTTLGVDAIFPWAPSLAEAVAAVSK
ncbi:MAG TPA: STAS domain-containing protein [Planctomycetota bacterium]